MKLIQICQKLSIFHFVVTQNKPFYGSFWVITYRHVIKFAVRSKLELVCIARSVKLGPRTEAFQPWKTHCGLSIFYKLCTIENTKAQNISYINEMVCALISATYLRTDDTSASVSNICLHYNDVIMGAIASQITSLTIVYSIVYSDADQRKHQSSASLVFVRGNHRGPVNSPHKWPVTRKMFPFHDVIMVLVFLAKWGRDKPTEYLNFV